MKFERSTELPVPQSSGFTYHARPGALARLVPPWEPVEIIRSTGSILPDSEVLLRTHILGKRVDWLARHVRFEPPTLFSDVQIYGPFASWLHTHQFSVVDSNRCLLTDRIDYELPLGILGKLFGANIAARKLDAMFRFRHRQTVEDLELGRSVENIVGDSPKTIAVSGCNGLVGKSVCSLITVLGHRLIRLDRSNDSANSEQSGSDGPSTRTPITRTHWNPQKGLTHPKDVDGVDAVIHLAGKGIGDSRWTESVRRELISSRVDATRLLCEQLSQLRNPPKTFVSASGVGIYGDTAESIVDEGCGAADDFLGKLATDWESASSSLEDCGSRRCFGRLGIVLDPRSGALSKLLPVVQWGLGGPLGSGKQYWSWISKEDAASAFLWLALNPSCHGAYNLVASAETNRQFTRILASLIHRPSLLPAPSFALRIALGEMADSLLLASTKASNRKLIASGFRFRNTTLKDALSHSLGLA